MILNELVMNLLNTVYILSSNNMFELEIGKIPTSFHRS